MNTLNIIVWLIAFLFLFLAWWIYRSSIKHDMLVYLFLLIFCIATPIALYLSVESWTACFGLLAALFVCGMMIKFVGSSGSRLNSLVMTSQADPPTGDSLIALQELASTSNIKGQEAFRQFLDHKSLPIQLAAINVLGYSSHASALSLLLDKLNSPVDEIRKTAIHALIDHLFIFYQQLSVNKVQIPELLPILQKAIEEQDKAICDSALETCQKRISPDVTIEWLVKILQIKKDIAVNTYTLLSLRIPPLDSVGQKLLKTAILGVESMAFDHNTLKEINLKVPEVCHACGINPPTKSTYIGREIVVSQLGQFVGGSMLGTERIALPIPVCDLCASNPKLIPVFSPDVAIGIKDFGKHDESSWRLNLRFWDDKLANQYAQLNEQIVIG